MRRTGVHFAPTEDEVQQIWDAYDREDDPAVRAIVEAIESRWDKPNLQQTDKAWEAIHRSLGDEWPLSGAILGGECVYFGDDYVVRLVDSDNVKEISTALAGVTYDWFAERFALLENVKEYTGAADADDLESTWSWFEELRAFFTRMATEGRAILFTAC
ncbi:MAG: YfbM family protein [Kofleriaceae bacterium]